MCALILVFALIMSLIINFAEGLIIRHNDEMAKNETAEALVTDRHE